MLSLCNNGLVKDTITSTTMPVDEWTQHELVRIEHRTEPRSCENYEELISAIETLNKHHLCNLDHIRPQRVGEQNVIMASYLYFLQEDLVNAWMVLIKYCAGDRSKTVIHHTQCRPLMLLFALDGLVKSNHGMSGLLGILFGKFKISIHLIQPWNVICVWARQFQQSDGGRAWMILGLDAYQTAKRRCLDEMTTHRHHDFSFTLTALPALLSS
ncbi:hypothetical protein DFQ28_010063 [Apophysomyces sp. BC1034]|nr:hypothetical protein DFQ30_010211 [Apophysomyces sp. BC1015]KAG0185042.1 hypothetical protein DFQ28_010063 [Apophysomyces sp. BC1034]